MIPRPAQRRVLVAHGLPVLGAVALLAVPLLPAALDVVAGVAGMAAAAIGGFRFCRAGRERP